MIEELQRTERAVKRGIGRIAIAAVIVLLAGACICLLVCAGCCRELHVHLGEKVYVTDAGRRDEESPVPGPEASVNDRQTPSEILDELIGGGP